MDLSTEIFITATTDLETILDFLDINEILAAEIQLSDFGDGVKEIIFEAIVLSKPSKLHYPEDSFDANEKLLSGSDIVDYHALKNSSIPEGTKLLVTGLFGLMDKYSGKIPQFDFEGLKRAISGVVDSHFAAASS